MKKVLEQTWIGRLVVLVLLFNLMGIDLMAQAGEELETPLRNQNPYADHTLLFYLYCGIIALYSFIRWRYDEFMVVLNRSFSSYRLAKIFFTEQENRFITPTILLSFNTILVLSLFVYELMKYADLFPYFQYWQLLILAIMFVLGFFLVKYFFQRVLALLLPDEFTIKFYLFNKLIMHFALGVFILPVLVLLSFSSWIPSIWLIFLALILFLIFLVLQYYRGGLISIKLIRFYPFHFFLYLCALEIAPVLLLLNVHNNL